jgi:hypothetical protein
LEAIGEFHPVDTQLFVPFAVKRLQERPDDTEAVLTVELRGTGETTTQEQRLRLFWEKESIPRLPLPVQDYPITAWAALGVACAVIWHFGGLRLHGVAAVGDGVDYWVKRETQEFALELAGQGQATWNSATGRKPSSCWPTRSAPTATWSWSDLLPAG